MDFTEVSKGKYGYKYLLIFIDTCSGWIEAFPTKHKTVRAVANILLEVIIHRYGVPETIGSDNGPTFVARISQLELCVLIGSYIVNKTHKS